MDRRSLNKARGDAVAHDILELADAARDFVEFMREFRNASLDTDQEGPWFAFIVSDPDTCAILQASCNRLMWCTDQVYPDRPPKPPSPPG
jgi:hypothetical protein